MRGRKDATRPGKFSKNPGEPFSWTLPHFGGTIRPIVTEDEPAVVMVSMSSRPSAMRRLLRQGSRLAVGLGSTWFVVYVRTPGEQPDRIPTETLRALADNTALARELGAEVVRLEGTDAPETLARFAHEHGVTHAVFGRTRDAGWTTRLKGSVLERFFKLAPEVDVLVVGTSDDES